MGRQTDGNLAGKGLELVFPGRRKQGFSSLVRAVAAPPPLGSAATSSAGVAPHCLPVQESLATQATSSGSSADRRITLGVENG